MVQAVGADYLGVLVDVPGSPRSLTVEQAKAIVRSSSLPLILLTFDLNPKRVMAIADELFPFGIQLAGNENETDVSNLKSSLGCEIWKTLHIPAEGTSETDIRRALDLIKHFTEAGADRIVLDSSVKKGTVIQKGGTGRSFDWALARTIKDRSRTSLFLAGGIKPDNVCDALLQVNPDGIDVSSGVEKSVGKKDPELVKRLIDTVKKQNS